MPKPEIADLQRKALAFKVNSVADDGSFELYGAAFNNVDRQGEVIAPGAFTNLDSFVRQGWGDVNHGWAGLGIATIDAAEQDSYGLKIRGKFHSTPDAQEVRTKVKERLERGKDAPCSIGYREIDTASEMRDGRQVRVLKQVELYEFSFVALPANPAAGVVGVKGGRVLSKATATKLKGFAAAMQQHAEAMHEHGQGMLEHGKAMHEKAAAAREMAGQMMDWLKGFEPGDDGPDAEPDSDPDDLEAKKSALKLRALKSRAMQPAP